MIWNLAAAMLAGAMLRFFRLGHQSLWIDEVFTWISALIRRPLTQADILDNIHGPLHGLLLHAWGGLAGDSEWALRFPSAVFGVLAIPVLAAFSARWLGSKTAVPAAWLAAGSPFLVWYSQEVRNYAMFLPFVALSWITLLGVREDPRPRRVIAYLGASSLALLTSLSILLLAPLHAVAWLSPRGHRLRRALLMLGGAVVLLAVLSPWIPRIRNVWAWDRLAPGARQYEALRGGDNVSIGAYPFTVHAFFVGYTLGPSIREIRVRGASLALRGHALELTWIGLLSGVLFVLAARAAVRRKVVGVTLLAVLVPTLLVSYAALQSFKTFHPRYVAVAFPFVLALLAAGLADTRPRVRAALAVLLGITWAVSLEHLYFRPEYGKEDMRSAAAFVAGRARPGDRIFAAGADDALIYYYRGPLPVERYWLGWSAQPGRMEEKLEEGRSGARNLWIVLSRGEDLDPGGRFVRLIQSRHPEAETYSSEGVRVWRIPGTATPDSSQRR